PAGQAGAVSSAERAAAVSGAVRGVLAIGYETASRSLAHVGPLLDEPAFRPSPEDRMALMEAVSRIANQADAALVRHAAELAEDLRLEFSDRHSTLNVAGEEIGNALGISSFTASRWIRAGQQVFGRLYPTGEVFERGDLTAEKAFVIAEMLTTAPDPLAFAVQDEILPVAPALTPREIKTTIARLLIELDPDGADERHATARRRRYVSRLRQAAHGMATFSVLMPADHAACVNTALETSARAAKSAGDARTHQELRADTLTSLAVTALREGTTITVGEHVAVPPTTVNVTVPLEVLARALPDWEGHPSPMARIHDEIMGAEHDTTGDGEHDTTISGEHDTTIGGEDSPTPGNPIEHPTGNGLAQSPVRDGRLEAAWLEGYGPIPPSIATLLAAGGTWRRIVTDTLDGRPLDVGRARYRPPTHLAIAVAIRDKTCSRPGCDQPAMYCDTDHLDEWAHGGETALTNLTLLCRRCHRAKTLGAGRLISVDTAGRRFWKSPLGVIYTGRAPRPPRRFIPDARSHHPGDDAANADAGHDDPPNERDSDHGAPTGPRTPNRPDQDAPHHDAPDRGTLAPPHSSPAPSEPDPPPY
nr:DUF222 domain-containing protein [Actinomycetales bacterium]